MTGRFACLGALACVAALSMAAASSPEEEYEWLGAEQILARIQDPVIPKKVYDIRDFGAKEGGQQDASGAIKAAIEACSAGGGGRVLIPQGRYATGPIHLLSNVDLHLEDGATLAFSVDPADYLPAVYTRWEGVECYNYSPLIYAFEQTNIAVTGKGTLDGQATADNWWTWKGRKEYGWSKGMPHQGPARDRLIEMGENNVPVDQRRFGEGDYLRPNFLQPYRCENVLIEGVTIVNSPMWEIHPVLCRNVTVRGVTVRSFGPNNDGCDPESCKDVLIENCIFETGDDCIAIKSGRNGDGRRVNEPAESIVVRNCQMKDGHGGVVIGSEISGGCRNVYVENCFMDSPELERAIRIKTNSVRGGLIENLFVRDVKVGSVKEAVIKINFVYEEGDAGDFTPIVRNVVARRLVSRESKFPLFLKGYERSPITGVRLIDCQFEGASKPSVLQHVKGLSFDSVRLNTGEKMDEWGNALPAGQ